MRCSLLPLVALLPLALGDDQIPFMDKAAGWFDKAKSYIPSVPVNPIDAGASEVAARKVERINIRNWQRKLSPKPEGEEEWLVYLTGGNKTCFGRCGPVDLAWNESVPLLTNLPQSNLRLGSINCEKDEVLCTSWSASLPSVYHFLVPRASDPSSSASTGQTPLHIIPLNISTTTVPDIVSIPSSAKARYTEYEAYTGLLHPFDSMLAKLGLLNPMGYALWLIGSTPSWIMMIAISFISRQIMSRRMGSRPGFGSEAGSVPQVPAPAAGAGAGAGAPASPKGAGGKKRK